MSNIHRDENIYLTNNLREDKNQSYHRKGRHFRGSNNDQTNLSTISNNDAKVYVGNVPTENLTDGELFTFFKPFGNISHIRVYKGYIFVQYQRIDDATKLIEKGETPLILKGNKLDILPAMDDNYINYKSSSNQISDQHYQSSSRQLSRSSDQYSFNDRYQSNDQPSTKRYRNDNHYQQKRNDLINNNEYNCGNCKLMKMADQILSSSDNSSHRLSQSPDLSLSVDHQSSYTILIGTNHPRELVHCTILIVNHRQKLDLEKLVLEFDIPILFRGYGEQILSRLRSDGLITSLILLREDYTLREAIQNARNNHCLYGIIAMPMHEERHQASFHILYGKSEEHRNLRLEDGYHLILTNFNIYKDHFRNEERKNCQGQNNESTISPQRKESSNQDQTINSRSKIILGEKFPLSMLLCLLADGRQLTLDEIDRVLVYLLQKKCQMLTLPIGTLPPLPAQYATVQSKSIDSSSFSSRIVEQIRQIVSSNLIKSSNLSSQDEQMSDIIPREETNLSQSKTNFNQGEKDSKQTSEPTFSYSNSNSLVAPSFHYSSSSSSTTNENCSNSYLPSNYSSFNSTLKESSTGRFASEYIYPSSTNPTENLFPTLTNCSAADAVAAIFQAYSQLNALTTPTISNVNQQIQK